MVALAESGIEGLPLTCRTLLETDTNVKTISFSPTTEVFYYDVSSKIVSNLERFECEVIRSLSVLEIQLHYDGIPMFKSSADTLWPLLASFKNLSPTVVFPLNLAMCTTKPDDISYLDHTVNQLTELITNGVNVYGHNIPIVILNVIADAPARSLLKKVKGHTGYYCCGRCTEKGTWIDRRLVILKTEGLILRTDADFRARNQEEHHLPVATHGLSPLLPLPIDMVTSFPQDYMHCMCLGNYIYV